MSETHGSGDVLPPRRGLPWRPPESKWAGRALFAAAGIAASIAPLALHALGLRRADDFPYILLPSTLGLAALVVARIRHGRKWRWASFLAGALMIPLTCLGAIVGAPYIEHRMKTRSFDATAWRGDGSPASSRRAWMVDDLLARHPLVGRTRAEVEALLGPPDDGPTALGAGTSTYVLGVDRLWIPIDFEILEIEYDADGRVAAARVRQT